VCACATRCRSERDIASRIRTIDYRTVLCRLSGVPREGFYLFPSSEGAAEGLAGYHSRYADQDVCTCYCYGAGLDDAALVTRLEERVAGIGGHLTEVLEVVAWPFMPHFRSEDVAAGIFDRLEKAQGEWRTYHAGSLLAFELIETTIAYARDLVRRFFTTPPRHIATVRVPAAGTSTTEEYGTTGSDAEDTARVPEVNGTRAAEADGARPQALPATGTGGGPAGPAGPPADEIREWLVRHVAVRLGDPEREVDPCRPIDEHGLDSLAIAELHTELSDWLGHPVPLTLLYRLPTLDALARYLESASR
jgi:acyl carrier protein